MRSDFDIMVPVSSPGARFGRTVEVVKSGGFSRWERIANVKLVIDAIGTLTVYRPATIDHPDAYVLRIYARGQWLQVVRVEGPEP